MRALIILVLSIFCSLAAASADEIQHLRETARSSNRALALVKDLVETAPYRFAGTTQDRKAVDWALKTLQAAGFAKVRAEPVTVPVWRRGEIELQLLGPSPQPLVAVALGGSVGTSGAGLSAPVLMVDSLDALYALPLSDIRGKIVFFNRRMERRADGSGYGEAVTVRSRGAAEAGRRGALAVLIRSIGTNQDAVPHTGSMRYDEIAPKIPAAALSDADADRLERQLLEQGRAEIAFKLSARTVGEAQSANVIGEIPGEYADEIVLLVAHLDSWDLTPGANDDAAGVATVIEAARLIRTLGRKPRRTLRVLLAANEEFGLSGAKAYAQAHAAELDQHVIAMEADFGSGAVQVLSAGVHAQDWPRIEQMTQALAPLGVSLGKNGSYGGADLGPLHARGVPVLAPRQDGTHYFDVHHTAADTLDRVDAAGLSQNVAVYAVLAWMAMQGDMFQRLPDQRHYSR